MPIEIRGLPNQVSSRFHFVRVLLFCLGVVGVFVPATAQVVGGTLNGVVSDESGAVLPGAQITVRSLETGSTRELITNETGRYAAPSLAIGRYEISANKAGFRSQVKTGVNLEVGQSAAVDFTLLLGQEQQVVTVEETLTPVNLSTQQTSGLISERQVKELPLNGRSFDGLLTLNPGIVNYSTLR